MVKREKLDNVQRRNIDLTKTVERLNRQLIACSGIVPEDAKKVKELIVKLEKIKNEWEETLDKIKEHEREYNELICSLRNFGDELKSIKIKR